MSDTELNAAVRMDLYGNFQHKAQEYRQSLSRFSQAGQRQLDKLGLTVHDVDRRVSRFANRTLIGAGAAAALSARRVVKFDAQLTRLKTNANLTEEQIDSLKESLFSVAARNDVRLEAEQIFAAVDKFMAKTGDLGYVQDNILNIAHVMQGLGVDAIDTGKLLAALWEKNIRDPKEVAAQLNSFFAQATDASVTAQELGRVGPELLSTITTKGTDAVTQMTALANIFVRTTGTVEKAKTSLQATFRIFNDPKLVNRLNEALAGADLDPVRKANGELRDVHTLLLDIASLGNYRTENFGFLDSEALTGFKSLFSEGNRQLLREMVEDTTEMNRMQKSSAENAATAQASINAIANAYNRIANATLTGPIRDLADAVNGLDTKTVETLADVLGTAAAAWVTMAVAAKGYGAARGAYGALKYVKKLASPAAATAATVAAAKTGTAAKTAKAATTIANGGAGLGSKLGGAAASTAAASKTTFASRALTVAKFGATRVLPVASAGAAGYAAGTYAHNNLISTDISDSIGRTIARGLAIFNSDVRDQIKKAQEGQLAALKADADIEKMNLQHAMRLHIELTGEGASRARILEKPANTTVSGQSMESY